MRKTQMKKIKSVALIALPLLMAGATVFAAKKGRENTAVILASYPKSDALTHYIKTHRDWVAATHRKDSPVSKVDYPGENGLFYGSSLSINGGLANQCTVDEAGRVYTVRDVYNWAMQASYASQLTKPETETLRLALQNLPENSPKPPLNQLLVLSFRAKKGKETRIYNRANLPAEVETIYRLANAHMPPYVNRIISTPASQK